MSLRRKSCDACLRGHRKCDRGHPRCATCRRTKKVCHYAYATGSQASSSDGSSFTDSEIGNLMSSGCLVPPMTTTRDLTAGLPAATSVVSLGFENDQAGLLLGQRHLDNGIASRGCGSSNRRQLNSATVMSSLALPTLPPLSIPSFMGGLGELQRIEGSTQSWQWVISKLKHCPRDFATRGETLFLHKELYRDSMPSVLRTVFGLSGTFCLLNQNNRQAFYQAVDAEVLELLNTPPPPGADADIGGYSNSSGFGNEASLLHELMRLQALVLYQMMRMFEGGLEQRAVVDMQQGLLTTRALLLLRRSRSGSVEGQHATEDWHAWIVAESIRRTVMIVYMFYAMSSMAMHGLCADFATLAKLPVSTSPEAWLSEDAYSMQFWSGYTERTLPYEAYTQAWLVSPHRTLHSFEKFLIIPCKGFEAIATYSSQEF